MMLYINDLYCKSNIIRPLALKLNFITCNFSTAAILCIIFLSQGPCEDLMKYTRKNISYDLIIFVLNEYQSNNTLMSAGIVS